jgi:threonine dehydrogenase-like Zn-dependent dehydrogenase
MRIQYARAKSGGVDLADAEISAPGAGEVLLEAVCSAVSPGTEHGLMAGLILPLPQSVGYSMVAKVVECGEGVTDYKPGDLVVAIARHATHLVQDQNAVTPAPDGVDVEQAAFFVLAMTSMWAVRRSKVQLGESAVVMGQGMVGSLAAQLMKLAGACPVIVTDMDEGRLERSLRMGADYAINVGKEPEGLDRLVESLGTGGVPIVLECTGSREPLESAFRVASRLGRVILVSTVYSPNEAGNADYGAILNYLFKKGISFMGCDVNSRPFALKRYEPAPASEWKEWPVPMNKTPARFVSSETTTADEDIRVYLNLIKHGALDIRPYITHRFGFEQMSEIYERVWNKDPDMVGAVIHWKQQDK